MKKILICFVISILFVLNSTNVYASCLGQPLSKYVNEADVIVAGVPISRSSAFYSLKVEKYYKGFGPTELKVRDPSFESPSVITSTKISSTLELQRRHLLYLKKSENDIYEVTACNGSRPLENEQIPITELVVGDYKQSEQVNPSPATPTNKTFLSDTLSFNLKLGVTFLLGIIVGALAIKVIRK